MFRDTIPVKIFQYSKNYLLCGIIFGSNCIFVPFPTNKHFIQSLHRFNSGFDKDDFFRRQSVFRIQIGISPGARKILNRDKTICLCCAVLTDLCKAQQEPRKFCFQTSTQIVGNTPFNDKSVPNAKHFRINDLKSTNRGMLGCRHSGNTAP